MLQKESVNRRLESEDGISFTEFSYLVLQAHDFLQLFDRYGCTLQMGGSDQWGNITAGIDLIRKLRAKKAHGLVWPLMKTAAGDQVRQDRSRHDLARRGADLAVQVLPVLAEHRRPRRASRYLKASRFSTASAIDELEAATTSAPEKREAQRVLAREVTALVHGQDQVSRAPSMRRALLFGEDIATLAVEDVLAVFEDVPSTELPAADVRRRGRSAWSISSRACSSLRRRATRGGSCSRAAST